MDLIKKRKAQSRCIKLFLRFVWPSDAPAIKRRVVIAFSLLVASKLVNVQVPILFKHVIDQLSLHADYATIPLALLIGYGVARISASLCNELRNAVFASVAQRAIQELSKKVFMHILNLDLSFHISRQTGALARIIERGTKGITTVMNAMVFNIFPTIFEITLVAFILGTNYGSQYVWITLGCMGAYATFTLGITGWRTQFRKQMNAMENEASATLIDSLLNYETIKYFGNETQEVKRYDRFLEKYNEAALKTQSSLALLNWGQNLIISSGLVALMVYGSKGVLNGSLTVGDLVMMNGLLFQLSIPLNFLGSVYRDTRQALIDMEAMFNLMSVSTQVEEKEDGVEFEDHGKAVSIAFEDVHFRYLDRDGKVVLKGLSFDIGAAKKVALVGPSGCGKTTIGKLLYRFYEPQSGSIKINGQPLSDYSLKSLRKNISIVPQDTVLFNDTIEYNIGYGDLEANKEEIQRVAGLARLEQTVQQMPNGYQTLVGERGLKISGGEKQRVAIARAILKDPSILIFDEATSSLDSHTEQEILESFKSLTKDKTTLIIAHRLSTIVDCDEILVLSQGQVVERGTHSSLLSIPDGQYKKMWTAQLQAATAEKQEPPKVKEEEPKKKKLAFVPPVRCGSCTKGD